MQASRRNLKWSQDPRNSAWTNSTSAFGHKMLQKMGWKKGKGLGANENGISEPVKLTKNKMQQGLGCTGYDDTWVAHQDNFSALLSELNKHSNNDNENAGKVVSLEETSKSQKRIHYKKFTKGKDLSNYNAADMNCIFGQKSHSLSSPPLGVLDSSDNENPVTHSSDEKNFEKHNVEKNKINDKLVMADCNITDYFKLKLEKLKQQNLQKITVETKPDSDIASEESRSKSAMVEISETIIYSKKSKILISEKTTELKSSKYQLQEPLLEKKKLKRKKMRKLNKKSKKNKTLAA